jgi:cytochrome c oxidase assembly factor CtaG
MVGLLLEEHRTVDGRRRCARAHRRFSSPRSGSQSLRIALWLPGLATVYLVSGGGFGPYAMALISEQMVQHTVLNM